MPTQSLLHLSRRPVGVLPRKASPGGFPYHAERAPGQGPLLVGRQLPPSRDLDRMKLRNGIGRARRFHAASILHASGADEERRQLSQAPQLAVRDRQTRHYKNSGGSLGSVTRNRRNFRSTESIGIRIRN